MRGVWFKLESALFDVDKLLDLKAQRFPLPHDRTDGRDWSAPQLLLPPAATPLLLPPRGGWPPRAVAAGLPPPRPSRLPRGGRCACTNIEHCIVQNTPGMISLGDATLPATYVLSTKSVNLMGSPTKRVNLMGSPIDPKQERVPLVRQSTCCSASDSKYVTVPA